MVCTCSAFSIVFSKKAVVLAVNLKCRFVALEYIAGGEREAWFLYRKPGAKKASMLSDR